MRSTRFQAVLVCAGVLLMGVVSTASANDGGPVLLGQANTSTQATSLTSSASGGVGLVGTGDSHGVEGHGFSGVYGISGGTYDGSEPTDQSGVVGYGNDNGGFFEGVDAGVIGTADEGVGGDFDGDETGVFAHGNFDGLAVTAGNTGITSTAPTALEANGEVKFSTAGLATIAKGKTNVVVNPGVDITSATKVLVTAQSGGGTFARVGRNFTTDALTLTLTGKATAPVTLAYFIIS